MTIVPEGEPTPQPAGAAPAPAPTPPAPPEKKKETWWSFLRFLIILFIATLVLRSCVVAPFVIPSASMMPNLLVGDYLFVSKWPYGYSRYSFPFGIIQYDGRIMGSPPTRGDIAVFRYPGPVNQDYVKRVIGLPGDKIQTIGGRLYINDQEVRRERLDDFVLPITENMIRTDGGLPCGGRKLEESGPDGQRQCRYERYRETLPEGRSYEVLDHLEGTPERCAQYPQTETCPADNFGPQTVPEGHVFMMGDNRDDSLDSRFPVSMNPERPGGVGMVPIDNLQGRALISFFSTDGSAEWLLPWTWFTAARWSRFGITYP